MRAQRRAPRPRAWALAAAALLVLGSSACGRSKGDDWQGYDRRASTLRELSKINAAMAPDAELAGISAYNVPRLVPLREPTDSVAASPAFHRFVHRCGACHRPPDPSMHTPAEWSPVLEQMKSNMRGSGLLPLRPEDERLIRRFLGVPAETANGG